MAKKSPGRRSAKKSAGKPKRSARPVRRNVKPWSADDIRRLRKLAGTMSATEVGKALGRSLAAVTFKAFTLRVSLRVRGSKRGRTASKNPRSR